MATIDELERKYMQLDARMTQVQTRAQKRIRELEAENERLRTSMARIRSHVSRALAEPAHLDTEELVHVMDELDAFEQNA